MYKIIAILFSVIFYLSFGLLLLIFHGIQVIALNLFGYQAHKVSVDILNFFLLRCLNLLGARIHFNNPFDLPTNRPLIIVANHQNTFDIPPLIWHLRKHHLKFVSKKELGKGIPSVSYNLRNGGSALIDRKKTRKAVDEIDRHAQLLSKNNWSTLIFPEGTRSRTGELIEFRPGAFRLATKSKKDIVVFKFTGMNKHKWYHLKRITCTLEFFPMIKYEEYKDMTTQELSDMVRNIILEG